MAQTKQTINSNRKRGRPVYSSIRQNLADMLLVLGSATGYELSKHYPAYFPSCTQRVIYYHLKKGVVLGVFSVQKITVEAGNYSWGPTSERIFYSLGPNAAAKKRDELTALVAKK